MYGVVSLGQEEAGKRTHGLARTTEAEAPALASRFLPVMPGTVVWPLRACFVIQESGVTVVSSPVAAEGRLSAHRRSRGQRVISLQPARKACWDWPRSPSLRGPAPQVGGRLGGEGASSLLSLHLPHPTPFPSQPLNRFPSQPCNRCSQQDF